MSEGEGADRIGRRGLLLVFLAWMDAMGLSEVALLVVGHGTRDGAGVGEFLALAGMIERAFPGRLVEACFLELAAPSIEEGMGRLRARGGERVLVVPLLLFSAGHAQEDVPAAAADAAERHGLQVVGQIGALECHPRILGLSKRRGEEALAGSGMKDDGGGERGGGLLILVARGGSDAEATAEARRFGALRGVESGFGEARTCFMAVQRPSLAEGLAEAGEGNWKMILVQPHLLFRGRVLDDIRRQAAAAASAHPDKLWIVAEHLGAETEVALAIQELVEQELGREGSDECGEARGDRP